VSNGQALHTVRQDEAERGVPAEAGRDTAPVVLEVPPETILGTGDGAQNLLTVIMVFSKP